MKKSAKKPAAKKAGRVTIRVGSKVIETAVAGLDPAAINDLVEQLSQRKLRAAPVELEVGDISPFSPSDREGFWALYREVCGDASRKLTLRVGEETFASPADWAASHLLVPTDDAAERCRALELAADILTRAYESADRDVFLDGIISKLRDRGFATRYCEEVRSNVRLRLRRQERNAGDRKPGTGAGGGVCDLARLFLNDRYPVSNGEACVLPGGDDASPATCQAFGLRYYGESFYRRQTGVWAEATAEDVKLELTTYLQGVAPDRTGVKPVADVFMNLKALCAVRVDGTPPLPFHLADPNRKLLAFQNGLLDLSAISSGKPSKLLPHDPNWFSTSRLSYAFDPAAKAPRFRAFLGQILDAEPKKLAPLTAGDNRVRVAQELFGSSLLTDNRFQTFGIWTGRGRNGKGTLFDVWQMMLGPENVSSVPLDAMGKEFGTEPLVGKLANLAGDMNEIDAVMEGTLKAWTGEDRVTVYRKYRSALTVQPGLKFVYACNTLPWFKDRTDGMWRRLIVVPFNYAPKSAAEVDAKLRPKLKTELPGILNWALRGLARLLDRGRFTECEVCTKAKDAHRDACSPVKEFIGNHFTLADGYDGPKAGKKWRTTTTEIKLLVKEYNAKFGERVIAPHIVCRELAGMSGVTTSRPTTVAERAENGNIYCGVCIGEPKQVIPDDLDELAEKSGLGESASGVVADPPTVVTAKKSKGTKSAKAAK